MKLKDLLEIYHKGGSEIYSIELASDNDSINVEVEFLFGLEPTETESGYVYSRGGADLTGTKIKPFTFEEKHYSKITSEIVGYIEFSSKFKDKNKVLIDRAQDEDKKHPLTERETDDLVKKYLEYVFDNYVVDKIDVPSNRYSMTT